MILKVWSEYRDHYDAYEVPGDQRDTASIVAQCPECFGLRFAAVVPACNETQLRHALRAEANDYGQTHTLYSESEFFRRFVDAGHAY